MNLDLPTVSVTAGPTWAAMITAALEQIAEHSHSTGDGVKVTPSGININSDLTVAGYNVTNIRSARLSSQGAVINEGTDLGCVVNVNGDLYWINNAGTPVQLTSGGAINIASVGTIGGDYGQPGVNASVNYSDITKTFTFLQNSGEGAQVFTGTLNIANEASGALSVSLGASESTTSYSLTLPLSAPSDDTFLSFDSAGQGTFRTMTGTTGEVTVTSGSTTHQVSLPSTITKSVTLSGNNTHSGTNTFSGTTSHSGNNTFSGSVSFTGSTSGRGIIPLGGILATASNLSGAYNCTATTAADANGFVQCNGQTISDGTSPMNGVVIPNINNNVFLMGSTTSGSTGGANSKTLTSTELPAHVHDMGHNHSNTFALGGTTSFASTSHTHNYAHSHQWSYASGDLNPDIRSTTSPSSSQGSYTSGGTNVIEDTSGPIGSGDDYYRVRASGTPVKYYTSGALNDSDGSSTSTGTPSASGTVSFSGAVTNMTGNTGSTGSGSSFDIRPSYISAKYIIRIK